MPVSNPKKTINTAALPCGGTAQVTLSFEAVPQLETVPADIVLLMDHSTSMSGAPLVNAKLAAKQFIEMVARASGDPLGQSITNGSRMGLVGFGADAAEEVPLSSDVADLEGAVDALTLAGNTNHRAAFELADAMLTGSTADRQVVVMFTDGRTTAGGSPDVAAEAMKQSGIEIFCIGLGTDVTPLNRWVTDPDATHVSSTNDPAKLQEVFAQAAAEVVRAGAMDALLRETLTDEFKLGRILAVSHGTVDLLGTQSLEWRAGAVGAAGPETAVLTFEVKHIGTTEGRRAVNRSVTYTDREGGSLTFPGPEVEITCNGTVIVPETCPLPATFLVEGCQDAAAVEAHDTFLSGLGRIVQVDAVVKNVCPGKKVAAALILTELDADGVEHARGTKTFLIPAQDGGECRDIQLKCISFVVPEELDVAGSPNTICDPRGFRVRVLANYVDTDFVCCDPQTVIL